MSEIPPKVYTISRQGQHNRPLLPTRLRLPQHCCTIGFVRLILIVTLLIGSALRPSTASAAGRVAVQPFGGQETEPLRRLVARIVRKHGFRVLTSLSAVSGTAQYPGLAKAKHLSSLVVADVVERAGRTTVSFLIWQGANGSVIGRWEVSASKSKIGQRVARDFWKHLGKAIERAIAPPSDVLPPAPTIRINAGTPIRDSTDPT
jgi:hypothetical protein